MTVRVGIVGLGDGGLCNLKTFRDLGKPYDVKVVGLCDVDKNRLNFAKNELSQEVFCCEDIHTLLMKSDADLVVIATPDNQHLTPAKTCLEMGRSVFIEKPLATSLIDLNNFDHLIGNYRKCIFFSEKYSFAYPVQAALGYRHELGIFMTGNTLYTMWKCDQIMGDGKWRTEHAYNPCAGGLSHNFMTAFLFVNWPISRIRATGQVLTYHQNLDQHGGYDTMEGTLEFLDGTRLLWMVCLAVKGPDSPFGHRTITHTFQFENGALVYGPTPESDRLIVGGKNIDFPAEESDALKWPNYNLGVLYREMHKDVLAAMRGEKKDSLHNARQGLNVAAACSLAFASAKQDGVWLDIPSEFRF